MIIKHGLVVDPASGLSEHMDILVKNGKIARIAPEIQKIRGDSRSRRTRCRTGTHRYTCTFRRRRITYKEDIIQEAKASAKGGFNYCNLYGEYIPYGRQYRYPKR